MFLQAERTPEEKMETACLLWKFFWKLYDPTREEDLMKNERTAKPMTECGYPRCEECDKCVDGYCTVPMVVSKQIYLNTAERIMLLEENVSALENLVYDEILGEGEDFVFDYDPQAKGIGDHTQPIYVGYYMPSRREDK